jgi:hypothetical protein
VSLPRHVKVTEHFVQVACERGLDEEHAAELWRWIVSGDAFSMTEALRPGERGAMALAGTGNELRWVVFMRDVIDPQVAVLLTLMDDPLSLQRRRDTRLVRRPS